MANRRCLHALARHAASLFFAKTPSSARFLAAQQPLEDATATATATAAELACISSSRDPSRLHNWSHARRFSSNRGNGGDEESEEDSDGEEGEEDWETGDDDDEGVPAPSGASKREYTPEEKVAEAAAIGYRVVGPLENSDGVFKPYEPVFAVVQIGSHQFKVSNGDSIFTERLKFCEVNDKLVLDKVLLLGSSTQTIVGRPTVPDATVHAVVEEHALDAKVLIFKKKRRKNYRRTKGHRQELTKLRITDIQGIEKPKPVDNQKPPKTPSKKQEKVAVAA